MQPSVHNQIWHEMYNFRSTYIPSCDIIVILKRVLWLEHVWYVNTRLIIQRTNSKYFSYVCSFAVVQYRTEISYQECHIKVCNVTQVHYLDQKSILICPCH
jgi:hypothetical protein